MLDPKVEGLVTAGEFGPILSVVLGNALRSQIYWGHWEQGAHGLPASGYEAVFRYIVSKAVSSYMVGIPLRKSIERVHPAYHGEIALDPATGAILRITVASDFEPPDQLVNSSMEVEYSSIPIGSRSYISPVRSLALYQAPVAHGNDEADDDASPVQTQLNDVTFVDYHLFRSESRVLTGFAITNDPPHAPRK